MPTADIARERMVVLKFPSKAQARNWCADPDCQPLSRHLRAGTRLEFLTLVHGLQPRA